MNLEIQWSMVLSVDDHGYLKLEIMISSSNRSRLLFIVWQIMMNATSEFQVIFKVIHIEIRTSEFWRNTQN